MKNLLNPVRSLLIMIMFSIVITVMCSKENSTTQDTQDETIATPTPDGASVLQSLTINQGLISPNFSSNTTAYSATVTSRVTQIQMSVTGESGSSTEIRDVSGLQGTNSATINLNEGANTITIRVISATLVNLDYTLTVKRAPQFLFITSFVYGSASAGELYLFKKNESTCAVTEVATYPVGSNAFDLTYDKKGFLYVANEASESISIFKMDFENEVLQSVGTVTQSGPGNIDPYGIAVHPKGWVYVADGATHGSLGLFSQNTDTGMLTQLTAPAYIDPGAGNRMWYAAMHPTANFLYVTSYTTATVLGYSVNETNGALTALIPASTATGANPWENVIHPSGNYIYIANYGSNSISQFSINNTTGALTPINTPIAAGVNPIALAVGQNFIYAGAFNGGAAGGVNGYSVNQTTGALTATAQGNVALTTAGVYGLQIDGTGTCLYVTRSNYTNTTLPVSIFTINQTTGALTSDGTIAVGAGPRFIKMVW